MTRKVDPIHFFNALGHSVLTTEHQGAEIDRLKKENLELRRRLKSAVERLRQISTIEGEKAN
ncbi:hypothetical protein [Mesorhizobium sp.]|uniref:hypothetical protein n=1 Tax=Mesorhizobium sp. TaxID=1871066 RepID=UPI000FE33DA7|nr:hypothetical protein [Mesorhizobium sp.]RWJ03502.1 MAG: hypothetical protein EOR24_32495 [Mesorhizobium sp.]